MKTRRPIPKTSKITCVKEIPHTADCMCFDFPANLIFKYCKDKLRIKFYAKKVETKKLPTNSLVEIVNMNKPGAMNMLQIQMQLMVKLDCTFYLADMQKLSLDFKLKSQNISIRGKKEGN